MAKSSFKLEFLFSKCFYKIASSSIISTGISTAAVHSCSSCCLHNNIDERREANFLLLSSAMRTSHIKKPHYPAPIKHKNLHIKSLAIRYSSKQVIIAWMRIGILWTHRCRRNHLIAYKGTPLNPIILPSY